MKFDHIAISVKNVLNSTSWYEKNFRAVTEYSSDTWAMLKIGDMKLALIQKNLPPPHFSLEINSFDDFPEGCEILTHRDGSYYFYQSDPDGNTVELIYWPVEKKKNAN